MRFEIGPVLRFETRLVARGKGYYALRVVFGLALLALLAVYHWAFVMNLRQGASPARVKDHLSSTVTAVLAVLHLVAASLVAPIAASDAFSGERARTMIPSLLVTRLSARQIVLGTFAARLVAGLSLWLCLMPVSVFTVPWCGVDPEFVAIMEGVTFGTILLGAAMALGFSLWSGRAFVALFGVSGLWGAWLLMWSNWTGAPGWSARTNPYLLLVSRNNGKGPVTLADAVFFLADAVVATTALLGLMAVTFRSVVLAPTRRIRSRSTRPAAVRAVWHRLLERLPGPTLDGNPILWREWSRARATLGGKVFWTLYVLVAATMTVLTTHSLWGGQIGHPDLVAVVGYEAGIGLLAIAVRAASSWSEEKGTGWEPADVLLATPLSSSMIVNGKWWGAYRHVLVVAILAAVGAVILAAGAPAQPITPGFFVPQMPIPPLRLFDRVAVAAVVIGQVLLYGAAFVSLGLLLATRLTRPGRALLATVGAYITAALVVPTVSEVLFMGSNRLLSQQLALISPVAAPTLTVGAMFNASFAPPRNLLSANLAALGLAGGLAWLLKRWTIHRFDRWMGRMPASAGFEKRGVQGVHMEGFF